MLFVIAFPCAWRFAPPDRAAVIFAARGLLAVLGASDSAVRRTVRGVPIEWVLCLVPGV